MQPTTRNLVTLLASISCSTAYAQGWTGVLDPTRAIDWAQLAGVPGGIPPRLTACATTACTSLSTLQAGTANAATNSAKINAALTSAPAGTAVLVPAGTWSITNLDIPSDVTLRGMGTRQTVLDVRNTSGPVITMGGGGPGTTLVAITAGADAGATAVLLASTAGVTVGGLLLVTELNQSAAPYYATIASSEGTTTCTWCDQWGGTRVRGQIVTVTSIGGSACTGSAEPKCVGITPLYTGYTQSPAVTPFAAGARYAGLEDLQIFANLTYNAAGNSNQNAANVRMEACAYCWVKGITGNYTQGDHVQAMASFRGEIRDSYFTNCFWHNPGQTEGTIFLANKTSGFLVENNIIERTHVALLVNWGAAGNVFGYNYAVGGYGYDGGGTYVGALFGTVGSHGAHPQYNLWEGNVVPAISPDSIWGSSSHNTAFRNWAWGTTFRCAPATQATRAAYDCGTGTWSSQLNRAMAISALAVSYNLVGNLGGSAALGAQFSEVAEAVTPTALSYDGVGYDWVFGYSGWAAGGALDNTRPLTTALVHGNYRHADGVVAWAANVPVGHNPSAPPTTLPASFYLTAKPAWWGNLPYPAIGPDVTGGTGPSGHASLTASNPAQRCFADTPKGSDGIALFDPASCYPSVPSRVPSPPTNLRL